MATSGIYKIRNKTNGKFYIGSSCDIWGRFYNHRSQLNRNIHDNQYLQNAWNKYGESEFEFVVMKKCQPKDLITEEQKELDIHYGKLHCYNLSPSADVAMRGIPRSDEVKLKCSLAQKGKPRWTEEQRRQMSIDRMGRTHSTETKKKMVGRTSSSRNIQKAQQTNFGRIYSSEHKSAISLGKISSKKQFSATEIQRIKDGVRMSYLNGECRKDKVPKSEYENIKSLYLSGEMNKRQMAFKYGINPSSMQKLLQRIGV